MILAHYHVVLLTGPMLLFYTISSQTPKPGLLQLQNNLGIYLKSIAGQVPLEAKDTQPVQSLQRLRNPVDADSSSSIFFHNHVQDRFKAAVGLAPRSEPSLTSSDELILRREVDFAGTAADSSASDFYGQIEPAHSGTNQPNQAHGSYHELLNQNQNGGLLVSGQLESAFSPNVHGSSTLLPTWDPSSGSNFLDEVDSTASGTNQRADSSYAELVNQNQNVGSHIAGQAESAVFSAAQHGSYAQLPIWDPTSGSNIFDQAEPTASGTNQLADNLYAQYLNQNQNAGSSSFSQVEGAAHGASQLSHESFAPLHVLDPSAVSNFLGQVEQAGSSASQQDYASTIQNAHLDTVSSFVGQKELAVYAPHSYTYGSTHHFSSQKNNADSGSFGRVEPHDHVYDPSIKSGLKVHDQGQTVSFDETGLQLPWRFSEHGSAPPAALQSGVTESRPKNSRVHNLPNLLTMREKTPNNICTFANPGIALVPLFVLGAKRFILIHSLSRIDFREIDKFCITKSNRNTKDKPLSVWRDGAGCIVSQKIIGNDNLGYQVAAELGNLNEYPINPMVWQHSSRELNSVLHKACCVRCLGFHRCINTVVPCNISPDGCIEGERSLTPKGFQEGEICVVTGNPMQTVVYGFVKMEKDTTLLLFVSVIAPSDI